MVKMVYLRLAWQTMRKNYRVYLPFLLGSIVMVMMLYTIAALAQTTATAEFAASGTMSLILNLGMIIMVLFSVFFYFYLNGFLNKNRQQEYGLFSVLGMEKHHLVRILLYQMIMLCGISIVCGLAAGVIMDKLMYLLISYLSGLDVPLGISFLPGSAWIAAGCTAAEYAAIFLWSCVGIGKSSPMEMLQQDEAGQKEPKNRWIFAILGLLCLAAGYSIAVQVADPVEAIGYFFVAVILVIIGTYSLFLFGSITLLKMLQKNTRYYYQTRHFLNISNMKYRMFQNAASLANICILSTMILVALSTTISLYAGIDSTIHDILPREYTVSTTVDLSDEASLSSLEKIQQQIDGVAESLYGDASMNRMYIDVNRFLDGNQIVSSQDSQPGMQPIFSKIMLQSEAGQYTDNVLDSGEVAVYTTRPELFSDTLQTRDTALKIQEVHTYDSQDPALSWNSITIDTIPLVTFVVPDTETFRTLSSQITVESDFDAGSAGFGYEEVRQAADHVPEIPIEVKSRAEMKEALIGMYSGLLFVGLFFSVLVLTIIILIMYYKQISEGYEDKKRFEILSNIGLESRDVRRLINQQALWMFFLPLLIALIHILFAYPMISKMVSALISSNNHLFIRVTLICAGIFALVYLIIYRLTARIYYSIVARP